MPEAFDPDKYIQEKAKSTQVANTFDPDKYIQEKAGQAPAPSSTDGAYTMLRSGLGTMTLGLSNPVLSGLNAGADTVENAVSGKGELSLDELKKNYDADVDRYRKAKEKYPVSNMVGSIGGAFSPIGPAAAVAGKVGGLIGKAGEAVSPYIPEAIANSKAGLLAGKVALGAAGGTAGALAQEAPRQVVEGSTGFIKKGDRDVPDLSSVAKGGAILGGAIPLAGAALSKAGEFGANAGKKLMASFLGPSEEHINYYLEHPESVNGARSIEELKDKVDGITDKLREDVLSGEKSVADAKSDLRDVEMAAADHRRQSNYDYAVTNTQVKQQFRDAKSDLDAAFTSKKRALESVNAPTDLADEANQAVKDLKGKIVEGSKAATDTLADSDTVVKTFSPYKSLQNMRDRLNIAGKGPVTPQAKAAAAQIDGLMATFGGLPGHLTGEETKALIKQLDASEQAVYNSPEFTDDVGQAYKTLRRELDTSLKEQNPKYAAAMKPVAENAKLHSDVVIPFGEKQSAISKLSRIDSPTSQVDRENLSKLGKATGRDFDTPVNKYVQAQGILKDPSAMENIRQSLPENQNYAALSSLNRSLEGPEAKTEFIEKNLKSSGLLEKQAAQEGLLSKRQGLLEQKKGVLEPFKNITPNSSESRLKTAMNARPGDQVELRRQLDDLSKLSDTDFNAALKNLKTKNAFNGQDTNGSRKVNLFGMIVGGLSAVGGAAMGHGLIGAGAGVPIGAAVGAVADKYGPKVAKGMLDASMKIKGSPTLAKIRALEIPPQVKAALAKELAEYNDPKN